MLFNCLRHNCSTSVQYSYYICIQHMQYMFTKFLWNMCKTEMYMPSEGYVSGWYYGLESLK